MTPHIASIFYILYALPAFPLLVAWTDFGMLRKGGHTSAFLALASATGTFLWLYSACFTQVLIGPSYSVVRECILDGNFVLCLGLVAVAFTVNPRFQIGTAASAAMTACFWAFTIVVNSAV